MPGAQGLTRKCLGESHGRIVGFAVIHFRGAVDCAGHFGCLLKFFREFGEEALGGPGTSFTECADGAASDVVGYAFEHCRIVCYTLAVGEAMGDFLHPERAFATRGALAAGFVGVEFVDICENFDHVAGVVHHDDAAGAGHGTDGCEGIKVHGDIFEGDFFVSECAVGLFFFDFVFFAGAEDFGRGAAGDDGFEAVAVADAATDVVNELAEGEGADLEFVVSGFVDVAGDTQDAGACVVGLAEFGVFGTAHANDVFDVAEGLDVVDDGGRHVEAEDGGEVGRLDAGVWALAFEGFDKAGFLSADVGTRAAVDVDFAVEAGTKDVFAEEVVGAGFVEGAVEDFCAEGEFAADVDVGEVGVVGVAGDDHALDELVGIFVDDLPVFKGAGFGFVGVADEVNRFGVGGGDE